MHDGLRPSATDAARDALDDLDACAAGAAALALAALPAYPRRADYAERLNRRLVEMLQRLIRACEDLPFEFTAVAEGVAQEAADLLSE